MRIGIASEHAGHQLKLALQKSLLANGREVEVYGSDSTEPIDYAPICFELGARIVEGSLDCGIAICGTGIGVSIAVNKVPGIRGALCRSPYEAHMSKRHNAANVLCLGSWVTAERLALEIVNRWLDSEFDGERHSRRIGQISEYENRGRCE